MYFICPVCNVAWSVNQTVLGHRGLCANCGAEIRISEETVTSTLPDDSSPPRLKTAATGLGLILAWALVLDFVFLFAPSFGLLYGALQQINNLMDAWIALRVILSTYVLPLVLAFAIGLFLLWFTHILNRD